MGGLCVETPVKSIQNPMNPPVKSKTEKFHTHNTRKNEQQTGKQPYIPGELKGEPPIFLGDGLRFGRWTIDLCGKKKPYVTRPRKRQCVKNR